jgi:hypothetical protein
VTSNSILSIEAPILSESIPKPPTIPLLIVESAREFRTQDSSGSSLPEALVPALKSTVICSVAR